MSGQNLAWGELQVILAICRSGSLAGAASSLGCNHSTVFRRINSIEERMGVRFFDRLSSGYRCTEAGEIALGIAERVEAEFHTLDRELLGRDARLEGTIRVASTEGVNATLLPDLLAGFCAAHPGVKIDLIGGNDASDLERREADIAIRATRKPPDESLTRRVCAFRVGPYGAPQYLAENQGALPEHRWISIGDTIRWAVPDVWRTTAEADARVVFRTSHAMSAVCAARAGIGAVMLPCFLGDPDEGLERMSPPVESMTMSLWILTHPVLRQTARVRALIEFLTIELDARRALFEAGVDG